MDNFTCAFCAKTAAMQCSRCMSDMYCNRECQSSDWVNHKQKCFSAREKAQIVSNINKKISGNISILDAYYRSSEDIASYNAIFVEINETLLEFVKGSIHFAHLRFVNDYRCDEYSDFTLDIDKPEPAVIYIFSNYYTWMPMILPANPQKIRAKYPKPGTDWSISFTT